MIYVVVMTVLPLVSAGVSIRPDFGVSAGLISDCPGVLKNASISSKRLEHLLITLHRVTRAGVTRRYMPIESAAEMVSKDKLIDLKNKKTVLYAIGFVQSSMYPVDRALATAYSRRGYNVFVTETFAFFSYIYPKSARLVHFIGIKMGEFLVKLSHQGLEAENLELLGFSLGAHVVSYAAKYFYKMTGRKPSRLTGLDPASPCFRSLDHEHRLWHTDAVTVDVVHTNIEGFGIAEPSGHVDFYINGGEYQPRDIPYIPCLIICSHLRALTYWWLAVENPKKFIGVQCESIQNARFGDCFNSSITNYMGLNTKFGRPGIFYVRTGNQFPYYLGKDGTKPDDSIFDKIIRGINSEDDLVI